MVKINEFGEIIFEKNERENAPKIDNALYSEFAQLQYEVLNNHHNPTQDPIKIARYNELKEMLNIKKSEDALQKAKEELKRKIIAQNESKDNAVLYTAMTQFKKTNN